MKAGEYSTVLTSGLRPSAGHHCWPSLKMAFLARWTFSLTWQDWSSINFHLPKAMLVPVVNRVLNVLEF